MPTLSQLAPWFIVIALVSSSAGSDKDLVSGSGATPDVDIGSIDENYWGGEVPTKPADDGKEKRTVSLPTDFKGDCQQLYYLGSAFCQTSGSRKQGYDTLKHFVQTCTPGNNFTTYIAFEPMSGAVQYMGGSKDRYVEYREWLKSVLYLNSVDPKFYCEAVEAILFTYSSDLNNREDLKSQLAIVQYLLESGKCDFDRDILIQAYDLRMQEWHKRWSDTTTLDTNLFQMDTTLPSLEALDLEILRGQANVANDESNTSSLITNVRALTNPFSASTDIEYTLGSTAQVELSLLNTLGQVVWHKPFGAVEDAAKHKVSISGSDLQPGSYFLRVATLTGEVKTVKLIRE